MADVLELLKTRFIRRFQLWHSEKYEGCDDLASLEWRKDLNRLHRFDKAARFTGCTELARSVEVVAKRLTACGEVACCCGACVRCTSTLQRFLMWTGPMLERRVGEKLGVLSIIPPQQLPTRFETQQQLLQACYDIGHQHKLLSHALEKAGISSALLGLDFSVNVHAKGEWQPHLQPHYWGLAPLRQLEAGRNVLCEAFPASDRVHRPLKACPFDGNTRGIADLLKHEFHCRVTLPSRHDPHGNTIARANTRNRPMTVAQRVALLLLLDVIGLNGRLLLHNLHIALNRKGQPSLQVKLP